MMQMENVTGKLDDINKTLKNMSRSLDSISAAVAKPKENKFMRAMEIIVLFGGITIFLTAADIIRNWVTGG